MDSKNVSNSFQVFLKEAPEHSKVWMEAVQKLAAVGLESGIPFHVKRAKELGATREDAKSAILIGLSAVGNRVVKALPVALGAFDEVGL